MHDFDLAYETTLTLERLGPRLEPALAALPHRAEFETRLNAHFPRLFRLLHQLYGTRYDFLYHLEQILFTAIRMSADRADDLKALDRRREAQPQWFQSQAMMGGVGYVDLFAGTLKGVQQRIPYLRELGLTYLHLMPLFDSPEGNNDGGYAVSSYRHVEERLGSMADLAELAAALRAEGISLVLDFVFNHTSDEHTWAKRALAGERRYQEFYYMFPDRALPDQYEHSLREIFPDTAPGSFTHRPEIDRWVWTTFHDFQWDLNYANPEVFNAMLGELLYLANQGVEVLRLDAVAFIWKQMGTTCESLPQVHWLIQAFNALTHIVCPAMLFKSEAIVHPSDVLSYVSDEECPISYNPTLMALSWEALATREVKLLRRSMEHWFSLPEGCAWVNYVRSHDDIGWTFADEDAREVGINGYDHRLFLNSFYTGRFPGSFAKGLPFNFNPRNQDMRISGSAASLAGLEAALAHGNVEHIDHSQRRLVLLYALALSAGGIPLLYLGDELATLNDTSYRHDPAKVEDSRWVHRPAFDWKRAERRRKSSTAEGIVFNELARLIQTRQSQPVFANAQTAFFDTGNGNVLAFTRHGQLLALFNFSEKAQEIFTGRLLPHWPRPSKVIDLATVGQTPFVLGEIITLGAYQFMWLVGEG